LNSQEQFTAEDVIAVASIINLEDGVFVVGGQALNLWAERFSARTPELSAYGPYTSKDIDYFGHKEAAAKLAEALGGKVIFPKLEDPTPSTALVEAEINGKSVQIDFICNVLGVVARDLENAIAEIAVPIRTEGFEDRMLTIPLMHPVHCLQSRVANVLHPATRRSDRTAMRQLYAAPIVVREYIDEALDDGDTREAYKCFQEIFRYVRSDSFGAVAYAKTPIDPFGIIIHFSDDQRIDERYRKHNIPSMIAEITKRREKKVIRSSS
jgi:hypothetical protein